MKQSAGILLYRLVSGEAEFLLVHPGGPFFSKKNEGWWTVPKGEPLPGEQPLDAAVREFEEETGYQPQAPFLELAPVIQKGGKKVMGWAAEGNLNAETIACNTFEIEWPPKSGRKAVYPEVDKAQWFTAGEAKKFINEMQRAFIDELLSLLNK